MKPGQRMRWLHLGLVARYGSLGVGLGAGGESIIQVEDHGGQHGQPIAIDIAPGMGEAVVTHFLKCAENLSE